jgi:intracellular sulfur oxidation DsrE/DsrF family protein
MYRISTLLAVVAVGLTVLPAGAEDEKGLYSSPTIEGYGKMHPLPKAAYLPNPQGTYKVVFALTGFPRVPTDVNPSLDRVARAVNLFVSAGVPLSHLKFVALAWGPATPLTLDDAHYKTTYGVSNPNLAVIGLLRKAGVDVTVCGQAVAERDWSYDWIDPSVTVTLSSVTTLTTLQDAGYRLMPL